MSRLSPAERLLAAVSLAGVVIALALASQVHAPPGGDDWTDGSAGAWLWILVGLVPAVIAGLVAAWCRRGSPRGWYSLGTAGAVVLATIAGEVMHAVDPSHDRRLLGSLGAGLDVVAVVMAAGMVGTLLRPRAARLVAPMALVAGAVTAVVFAAFERPDRRAGRSASRSATPGAVAHVPRRDG